MIYNKTIFSLNEAKRYKKSVSKAHLYKINIDEFEEICEICPFLKELTLNWLESSSLPMSICKLHKLKKLYLLNTEMSIINTSVPSFKLEELVIRQCSLEKLPDWFYKQEKLTYVDLWQNDIQIISENIENLRRLKFFRLGFNRLKELPKALKNMKSLKFLDIRGNLWPESFDYSSFSFVKDFCCEPKTRTD